MSIITLTTDWGNKDFYLASVKGSILTQAPSVTIVDITHSIIPFNIIQASIILKNSWMHFPKGTIHVIGVNSLREANAAHFLVEAKGHYFIGADNGIFSIILDDPADLIIELDETQFPFSTFPTRDVFVKVACLLASGREPASFGKVKEALWERVMLRPVVDNTVIRGTVIYVDSFENAITNITRQLFMEIGKGRPFTLYMKRFDYDITELSMSYGDVEPGEKLAFFNTLDLLEIAINKGNAAKLLGLKINDPIRIEFHDQENS